MESMATTVPVSFPSYDGSSVVKGRLWEPTDADGAPREPVGLVQIVHGMSEHVGRYDEFARYLAGRGFAVCGADHIGHGASVADVSRLGCLPPDGKEVLIEDVHDLRMLAMERFAPAASASASAPGALPYFLFGHSMGSFVVRTYLARHGAGVTGAVVCGTGQQPLALSKLGHALSRAICDVKGCDYKSKLLDSMGVGAFSRQVKDARTPNDWISTDPAVVDAYASDELCGAMFSAGGYAVVTDLTGEAATRACAAKVPPDVPVLFVAGAEDPVGAFGKGVRAASEQFRRAGVRDVRLKLYEGMRHEILNEPGRAQVFADVAAWMEEHL